jgi:hypothetical protein
MPCNSIITLGGLIQSIDALEEENRNVINANIDLQKKIII